MTSLDGSDVSDASYRLEDACARAETPTLARSDVLDDLDDVFDAAATLLPALEAESASGERDENVHPIVGLKAASIARMATEKLGTAVDGTARWTARAALSLTETTASVWGRMAQDAQGVGKVTQGLVGHTVGGVAGVTRTLFSGSSERASTSASVRDDLDDDDATLADMTDVLENVADVHDDSALSVHVTPSAQSELSLDECLASQSGRCAQCRSRLRVSAVSKFFESFRPLRAYQRCEYDGFVYCDACAPATSFAVIPWRVLRDWDWKPRRVSAASRRFIAHIERAPVFVPRDVNPSIFTKVKTLGAFRDARVRARAEIDALRAREDVSEALVAETLAPHVHFVAARDLALEDFDPEAFSLDVLFAVHKNAEHALACVRRASDAVSCVRRRLPGVVM